MFASSSSGDYEDEDAGGAIPGGPSTPSKQAPRRKAKKQDVSDDVDPHPTKRSRVEPKANGTSSKTKKSKEKEKRASESAVKRAQQAKVKKERNDKFKTEMTKGRESMLASIEAGKFKPTAVFFNVPNEPTRVLHYEPGELSKRDYEQLIACHGRAYSEEEMDRTSRLADDYDDDDDDGGDEDDDDDEDWNEDDGDGDEEEAEGKRVATKRQESKASRAPPPPSSAKAKQRAKRNRDLQATTRELVARLANKSATGLGAATVSTNGCLHSYDGWWVFTVTSIDDIPS